MTRRTLASLALGALLAAPLLAQASSLEDLWRRFLDANPKIAALRAASGEALTPTVAKRTDTLPLGKDQWVVFVAPGCRSCDAAVARARQSGAKVEVFDIARSRTGREAFAATGAKGFPALLIGNYLVTGFSNPAFERAVISNVQDETRAAQGNN